MTTFCVRDSIPVRCPLANPHHRSVRNVASAGSSAELLASLTALMKHLARSHRRFEGGGIPRDEMVQCRHDSGPPVACEQWIDYITCANRANEIKFVHISAKRKKKTKSSCVCSETSDLIDITIAWARTSTNPTPYSSYANSSRA